MLAIETASPKKIRERPEKDKAFFRIYLPLCSLFVIKSFPKYQFQSFVGYETVELITWQL
tara:strand:- start:335 stop:514 length:180 start_codon:yes stop_codon:yes gene_type:complete